MFLDIQCYFKTRFLPQYMLNPSELTKFCKDITNNTIRINSVKKTSPYDVPYYISNINYVKKLYKWKPKRDLKKVITDLYNWTKVNKLVLRKYF